MSEAELQVAIRLALGRDVTCAFWRNNVGVATFKGQMVRYGLSNGSSDLIGVVDGRFCALEVKTDRGTLTSDQELFLSLVRAKGGFACVVRSVDDALSAVERCKRGESQ